ncbi:hypothetical protein BDK51DRAFT_46096 [Blyttiomyces helicus]|uniref:SET domain-containing protein n=1 Tax=Blyttiomyces helicus TaxID=388810 RepID=A0A4P9WCL5_9FUNG|nr:hypothetical protein BDK51DRAFT_46096 [Blyttiomyces helicus]|eukprot:RKO90254.1 hypothetical protein BDK51DRAFT_46096 [Blyttiomyces helicus]
MLRVLRRRMDEITGSSSGSAFDAVWALCDNRAHFSPARIASFSRIATALESYLRAVGAPADLLPGPLPLHDALISLISREECNSFGVYTFARKGPRSGRDSHGLALIPDAVYFNHGCLPNVGHVSRNVDGVPAYLFYALRDLDAGEEAEISYVELDDGEGAGVGRTVTERRDTLERLFLFRCDCARCRVEMGGGDSDVGRRELARMLCLEGGCRGRFVPADMAVGGRPVGLEEEDWVCEACGRKRV